VLKITKVTDQPPEIMASSATGARDAIRVTWSLKLVRLSNAWGVLLTGQLFFRRLEGLDQGQAGRTDKGTDATFDAVLQTILSGLIQVLLPYQLKEFSRF
jgi:hypothetical protein